MNQKFQNIMNIIQQSELDSEQKENLINALKDVEKELEITAFKLDRTEKVKKTTAILLEETIEELEQKRKAVEEQAALIRVENERKTIELEEARQMQLSMLPKKLPQISHLDIAVYMQTATEVGGDYYDFCSCDDGSLNICLGDATGHGMKAGIMVSSMKSIFTTNAPKMDIEQFFETANTGIKSMNLMRMMMGLVMVNINSKSFKLINAGMPPVFFYSSKSDSIHEIKEHGMPVGATRLSNYKVVDGSLQKGDVLLLLSDGMPELAGKNNEMFGYNRLLQTFNKVVEKKPNEIIDHLKNVAAHWADNKDPDDDVTFVVIKVKS